MESTSLTSNEKKVSAEEATMEFFGSLVRLDCGDEGVYQGVVVEVDPTNSLIKIEKPFRNGISLGKQIAEIPGELIEDVLVVPMNRTPEKPKLKDGWVPVVSKKSYNLLQKGQPPSKNIGTRPSISKFTGTQISTSKPTTQLRDTLPFVPLSVQLANRKSNPAKKILSITPPLSDDSTAKQQQTTSSIPSPLETITLANSTSTARSPSASNTGKKILTITPPLPDNPSINEKTSSSVCVSQKETKYVRSSFRTTASPFVPSSSSVTREKPFVTILTKKKILSITPPPNSSEYQTPSSSNALKISEADNKAIEKRINPVIGSKISSDEKNNVATNTKKSLDKKGKQLENVVKQKNKLKKEMKEKPVEKKKVPRKENDNRTTEHSNDQERKNAEETGTKKQDKTVRVSTTIKTTLRKEERNKREKEKRAALKEKEEKKKIEEVDESLENLQQKMGQLNCERTLDLLEDAVSKTDSPVECSPSVDPQDNQCSKGSEFVGCLVSVTSANSDIYQGKITAVNAKEQSVRLENPLLNGRLIREPFIEISGEMMKDIRIVRAASPSARVQAKKDGHPKMNVKATEHTQQREYRQQQIYFNNSDDEHSASGNSTSSTYYSLNLQAAAGYESEGSIETEIPDVPRTFDQWPIVNQQRQTPTPTKGSMLVATPSSVYTIKQCSPDSLTPLATVQSPVTADDTTTIPRQRRLTCAQRMVLINQRQQQQVSTTTSLNSGENSRTGTPTYAARERQTNFSSQSPSIQPLLRSSCPPTNSVKIYMQSGTKLGGPVTAILPKNTTERASLGPNRNKTFTSNPKSNDLSNSANIMQKLFSPMKSDHQHNMTESKQQTVLGQRINVNDLMRGVSGAYNAIHTTEPPISGQEFLSNSVSHGGYLPVRRPLSAAIVSSPVVGSSGYSRNRNCSGTASLGSPCAGGYSAHYTNNKRRSPPETPPTIPLAHQAFGEFKLFKEQQQATPMRLQMGQSRNIHSEIGPTGIPAVDCSNGYRSYSEHHSAAMMGDPMDPELDKDFDFAGNLALFDKAEFNRETEHIFKGLDSAGDHSRNYRNDENVLQDSSRIISWKSGGVSGDEIIRNTSSSSPAD